MMRTVARGVLAGAIAALWACGATTDLKDPANACARIAQIFRGLPAPVSLTSEESEAAGLTVSISYRGMNDFNAPVAGAARCVFRREAAGALRLLEASVDGQELAPEDLPSLNRTLTR